MSRTLPNLPPSAIPNKAASPHLSPIKRGATTSVYETCSPKDYLFWGGKHVIPCGSPPESDFRRLNILCIIIYFAGVSRTLPNLPPSAIPNKAESPHLSPIKRGATTFVYETCTSNSREGARTSGLRGASR